MEDLFLKAARSKLRFTTSKGHLTAEDLFDLPLTSQTGKTNLDDLAKGLYHRLKNEEEVSFVESNPKEDSYDRVCLEIVKAVIAIKIDERKAASAAAEKAATRQKIMALMDQKKDAALSEKSLEELTELLKSLG
jgi:hypothetical protein